jgi:hypothetical protein
MNPIVPLVVAHSVILQTFVLKGTVFPVPPVSLLQYLFLELMVDYFVNSLIVLKRLLHAPESR